MTRTRLRLLLTLAAISIASGPARAQALEAPRFLVGGSGGLALVTLGAGGAEARSILTGSEVRSVVPVQDGWFFVGASGLLFSPDLASFEPRTAGLPVKTLLVETGEGFSPRETCVEIKALAVDPRQNGGLGVLTANEVFFSPDWGKSWTSLGSPSNISGYRAISFGPIPGRSDLGLWVSHSIKGLFVRPTDAAGVWTGFSAGLPKLQGSSIEETAGFALMPDGSGSWRFAAGLSFLGRMYEWDGNRSAFTERYSDGKGFGSAECLEAAGPATLGALSDGFYCRIPLETRNGRWSILPDQAMTADFKAAAEAALKLLGTADCAALLVPPATQPGTPGPIVIDELWRLLPLSSSPRGEVASGKQGLYLQTGLLLDPGARKKYFDLAVKLGLNSLVVDMKDEAGRLWFAPKSAILASRGTAGARFDIESFVAEAKRRGIYLIARITVFKDKALNSWNSGALAVKDAASGKPWQGLRQDGRTIEEYWVDPYSPEVWRYNIEVAREAIGRGFDEIQFDYIRFPTDGTNTASLRFPAKPSAMDQDGALESFLGFARASLDAPIGVDIYGSNGWYRTGSRTGQDVEMLAKYVDVICPMLYPSHFEQDFLAQEPAVLRPYRIYSLGTLRNYTIARGRAVVRPYVQAFYLDVSYDRQYYNLHYVQEEVRGVRDGANQGMTFWNNVGRYDDVPSMK